MLENYYHLSWVRKARSIFRKLGLLAILKSFLAKTKKPYEQAFHNALKASVLAGDVVWDIGANVGLYTNYFLDWVGEAGEVVAFEPLPSAFLALTMAIGARPKNSNNAILKPIALSDYSGDSHFSESLNDSGNSRTAHLSNNADDKGIQVRVETADLAVAEGHLSIPNVVKIDVEGFEESVLLGGEKTFANMACRHLLIEIHFQRMDDRNLGDSAGRIVKMLKKWGYKVRWLDPSHLHAYRSISMLILCQCTTYIYLVFIR